jgi:LacI family transcriptional regulator
MVRQSTGIRGVAEAASVSVTTVSHALSGRGQVSDETRQRVLDAAARLGYTPNRIARALRASRSNVLGFVSEEIATTPFAGQILVGAQEAAAELGLMLMIVNVPRGAVDDPQIGALLEQQVDAMIFASSSHREIRTPGRLDPLRTVLLDAFDRDQRIPSVVPDEFGIGYLATRRLVDSGHRRIVHLTVDEDVPAVVGRVRGYLAATAEAGLQPLIVRVAGPADARAGSEGVRRAVRIENGVTAVFAFNDQMAMGVYQEISLNPMVSIPHEVSVIGVDDLRLIAEALRPGLTTVALPHAEMGRRAVQIAARLPFAPQEPLTLQEPFALPDGEGDSIRLPGTLVERQSVAGIV